MTAGSIEAEFAAIADESIRRLGIAKPELFARLAQFAATLATWGAKTNLTAHPDDPAETLFHVIDSLMPFAATLGTGEPGLVEAVSAGRCALDLGSGAGFPGLILAANFDAHFTLVESRRKRASFLTTVAAEMGLVNVAVDSRRATPSRFAPRFELITARAVGDIGQILELAAAALKANGLALLYAGPHPPALAFAEEMRLRQIDTVHYAVPRRAERVGRTALIFRKIDR